MAGCGCAAHPQQAKTVADIGQQVPSRKRMGYLLGDLCSAMTPLTARLSRCEPDCGAPFDVGPPWHSHPAAISKAVPTHQQTRNSIRCAKVGGASSSGILIGLRFRRESLVNVERANRQQGKAPHLASKASSYTTRSGRTYLPECCPL